MGVGLSAWNSIECCWFVCYYWKALLGLYRSFTHLLENEKPFTIEFTAWRVKITFRLELLTAVLKDERQLCLESREAFIFRRDDDTMKWEAASPFHQTHSIHAWTSCAKKAFYQILYALLSDIFPFNFIMAKYSLAISRFLHYIIFHKISIVTNIKKIRSIET